MLGYLSPEGLAGGSLEIDPALSEKAVMAHIGEPLGLGLVEAASGIRKIANVAMARAIRSVTVERGRDPRDMALMAFGGSGPAHAVEVAGLLGIGTVIVPAMSGVFCSVGMLASDVEHNFVRNMLRPLDRLVREDFDAAVHALRRDGAERLSDDGFPEDRIDLSFGADLRYAGQSSELTVPIDPAGDFDRLYDLFQTAYGDTYGYTKRRSGRNRKFASVREGRPRQPAVFRGRRTAGGGRRYRRWRTRRLVCRYRVRRDAHDGANGRVGGACRRPGDPRSLRYDGGAAARRGCQVGRMRKHRDRCSGKRDGVLTMTDTTTIDPITFAVIKNGLDSIVDEMAYDVIRTARSEIVKDVMDYSAAICDRSGNMIAQAKTVALHLGAVPEAMGVVLDHYGDELAPGDAVILNDPYQGGMHLPDIFMFMPIFHGEELQGFTVVICHHTDVGGRMAGSNASDSTEIFQEGLRIPALKLFEAGKQNETLLKLIEKNVRLPDRVIGDLKAQFAACRTGAREMGKLFDRYGAAEAQRYFAELLDYAERMTRDEIRKWPDGTYQFTDYIDDDGFTDKPLAISVEITVHGDSLTVDYAGSAAAGAGGAELHQILHQFLHLPVGAVRAQGRYSEQCRVSSERSR